MALDTLSVALTRHVPRYTTKPPASSIRFRSSWNELIRYNRLKWVSQQKKMYNGFRVKVSWIEQKRNALQLGKLQWMQIFRWLPKRSYITIWLQWCPKFNFSLKQAQPFSQIIRIGVLSRVFTIMIRLHNIWLVQREAKALKSSSITA